MLKTVIIILVSFVALPGFCYYLGDPLSSGQVQLIKELSIMAFCAAMYCFIVSEVTKNYSQVDKLWSVLPILYTAYVVWRYPSGSVIIMALLVAVWGVRLTYNFSRRGAYQWKFWQGEEDYRWAILRAKPEFNQPWRWRLFNLFFISLYQNGLILLFTLPIITVAYNENAKLTPLAYVFALLMLGFIMMEYIADQQQWNYQSEKHRLIKAGLPLSEFYAKGFTHTGLWAYMRHPNYAAEQAIWICFYLIGAACSAAWINWSAMGFLLLLLLFQGSSDFSESISAAKYPKYKEYQKMVGRFIPRI
ncbi:MAG: DUF1295 domain-containing protein [Saprospiraceae bacterium]|nr:DUF1295 domain-containing protein [Saprospiraceae bacterium]HMW39006.1 DUF1295 domain-containing protein [Saprospiraceae bacterium]HMX87031.1 DUF1295 domain-containing protein [Saprospiraceae bacterium]HMZ41256.1 DUF1295 domain-containing protein [Saprospiraceae bacterium]HNA63522.1 DUF1295 domain-containing protein [Saprospiraceae bacterium]